MLDDEIVEKIPFVDGPVVEDSYKASIVYCLMCLGYTYMELRHYTEAISCLDESLEIAGDKVPDLYFRRAQAICYNKFSNSDDYKKALEDINKAISLKKDSLYIEFLDKFKEMIEQKKKNELDSINSIKIYNYY